MAKKILIEIALQGDAEIKRKLQEVADAGKKSFDGAGIAKNIGNEIGGIGGKLQQAVSSGLGGVGGGFLGGLVSKLTSPGGIIAGLGAALSASLIGSSKQIDERQRTQGRLTALGDAKGSDRLTERAKTAGEDVSNLQNRYEKFLTFQQKFNARNSGSVIRNPFAPLTAEGQAAEDAAANVNVIAGGNERLPPSRDTFGKADNALLAQIRRDVKSSEEANQVAGQFQEGLLSGGLTPDLLRSLPPNARNFVTQQIGKGSGRGFANAEELIKSMNDSVLGPGRIKAGSPIQGLVADEQGVPSVNVGPTLRALAQPNAEFEKAAKDARSPTQALEALSNAVGRQFEPTKDAESTNKAVGSFLDDAAKRIDQSELPPPLGIPAGILGTYFNKGTPLPIPGGGRTPGANLEQSFSSVDASAAKTSGSLDSLSSALEQAATNIRNRAGGETVTVPGRAGGGAVFGAGTATSDSIPAMLSHGEYVVNAASVSKVGLAYLDAINSGRRPGYADGGNVAGLAAGTYDVVPTDDGGAIINGVKYGPGSPILEDPNIKAALARARAAKAQDQGKKRKSDFVGIFGGHVFDTPGSYARGGPVGGRRGFARGGSIRIPHFAFGGETDIADIIGGAAPSLTLNAAGGGLGDLTDFGRVELADSRGSYNVIAHRGVVDELRRGARDKADVQIGQSPSWVGGGR